MKILNDRQARLIDKLAVRRLIEYTRESGIKCFVLGISGGIDSAVVAMIGLRAAKELNENGYSITTHYSFLDIESDVLDHFKARQFADYFEFDLKEFDLTNWYRTSPLLASIPKSHPRAKIAQGNIKCRLRMIALMNFAQLNGGLYLDTDDLSEWLMGFWTRHGDEGDLKIIEHLTKDEVYDLGEYYFVPQSIQNSEPGDGLGVSVNNQAKDQLGLPYMETDYVISRFIQNGLDTQGHIDQLESDVFIKLTKFVSQEICRSEDQVTFVLKQCLKTAFKRRYGNSVACLLPNRSELELPEIGTVEFNDLYLAAIQKNRL
jgi:NAD+ synthase